MSPTSKGNVRTYSSFKQYKGKFFPGAKPELDYGLPPEEFGEKLAEEWAKEYKKVLDEFLKQLAQNVTLAAVR